MPYKNRIKCTLAIMEMETHGFVRKRLNAYTFLFEKT